MSVAAGLGISVILSACGASSADKLHLAILRREALATAQAPGTTPWLVQGQAASTGIGFGGRSPTELSVDRRLQGSRSSVTRYYAQTAILSGWRVNSIRCAASSDSFTGAKEFPGWVASVVVTVGNAFLGAPAVAIFFETDDTGSIRPDSSAAVSGTLTPRTTIAPLTVESLADTCLGAAAQP